MFPSPHTHTQALFNSLIKAQNEALLGEIATKYDLDPDELRTKYLTPSFYDITYSRDNIYNTEFQVDKHVQKI